MSPICGGIRNPCSCKRSGGGPGTFPDEPNGKETGVVHNNGCVVCHLMMQLKHGLGYSTALLVAVGYFQVL